MKGVMKYLPRGTLFNYSSFQRAVRAKQVSEDTYGVQSPRRNRGFDKYETEAQVVGTFLVKNGFTTSEPTDLGKYSTDLLEIHQIYEENLFKYFSKRVKGVETTSLKLKKVNFTQVEKEKSDSIEMKTKEELRRIVFEFLDASDLAEEEIEDIKASVTKSKPKQFLVNMYNELMLDHHQESLGLGLDH